MEVNEMKIIGTTLSGDETEMYSGKLDFSKLDFSKSHLDGSSVVIPYAPENHTELFDALTCAASESGDCDNTPEVDETKTEIFLWVDTAEIPIAVQLQVCIYPIQYSVSERLERLQWGAECDEAQGKNEDNPFSELATWKDIIAESDAFYAEHKDPEYQFFDADIMQEERDILVFAILQHLTGGLANISFND
jgi:hypothetical protein